MRTIEQITTPADIADVANLIREYTTWAISLDPDTKDAPTFTNLEKELSTLPGKFAPPTGCFLIARDDDAPVGCVAFLDRGDDIVELKRMYVRPDQRGKGTGVALAQALIAQARAHNARHIKLSSYHTMTGAHKIYRGLGFKDIDAPDDFPEQFKSSVVFMKMDLL